MTATAGRQRVQIPALAAGMYHAVCTMVIDLGIQRIPAFKMQEVHQVRILWEIVGETIQIGDKEFPRLVSKDYTLSLSANSNLRKALESWRGAAFTEDDLQGGFDFKKLCGVNGQLLMMPKPGKKGSYTAISGIIPLQQGTRRVKPGQTFYFDMEDPATYTVFEELPRYIQETIAKAVNFADTGLELLQRANNGAGDFPPENGFGSNYA